MKRNSELKWIKLHNAMACGAISTHFSFYFLELCNLTFDLRDSYHYLNMNYLCRLCVSVKTKQASSQFNFYVNAKRNMILFFLCWLPLFRVHSEAGLSSLPVSSIFRGNRRNPQDKNFAIRCRARTDFIWRMGEGYRKGASLWGRSSVKRNKAIQFNALFMSRNL